MKITVNPDKEHVQKIRQQLKENNNYCPCSLIQNEDTKCMCKEFREMEEGMCHCQLYVKTK
jgi:ferredoxin-thioredoxin reductase catalytic subunit